MYVVRELGIRGPCRVDPCPASATLAGASATKRDKPCRRTIPTSDWLNIANAIQAKVAIVDFVADIARHL